MFTSEGKSTVTSILALHKAIYKPPALVLLLSPSLRQSQELFSKVKNTYDLLPVATKAAQETAPHLRFESGSRLVALPGKEAKEMSTDFLAIGSRRRSLKSERTCLVDERKGNVGSPPKRSTSPRCSCLQDCNKSMVILTTTMPTTFTFMQSLFPLVNLQDLPCSFM